MPLRHGGHEVVALTEKRPAAQGAQSPTAVAPERGYAKPGPHTVGGMGRHVEASVAFVAVEKYPGAHGVQLELVAAPGV